MHLMAARCALVSVQVAFAGDTPPPHVTVEIESTRLPAIPS